MNNARAICREAGGSAKFAASSADGPGFETRVDLNQDRIEDYIFDYQGLSCESRGGEFINPGMCGSAGCQIAIYLSGPAGHTAVPTGNVQSWELVRTNPPKIRVGLHGSTCGRVGADTCYEDWGWNGRRFGKLDLASARVPASPVNRENQGWTQTTGANGYRVASIRGLPSPIAGIALTCERNVPMLAMNLGRRPGRTVTVNVAATGGRAELAMMPVGTTGAWAAPIRDTRVLDLLSGSDDQAQMTIAGEAVAVPLAGARESIGAALVGCYRVAAVGSAANAQAGARPAGAAAGPLAEAERFIDNLYRRMANPSAADPEVYTPELAALDRRWSEAFARSGEEGEPMDPLCESVDCGGIRLVARSVRALPDGRAEALVRYDFPEFGSSGSVSSQRFVLERTPSGWRIADILGSDGSYVAGLRRDLARWEGARRRR